MIKKGMDLTDGKIMSILREQRDILKQYRVKKIGLFGSYVRGKQKNYSDIDFLVEFDLNTFGNNYNGYFDNYMKLLFSLEEIFGKKIDLLTTEMISPYIKPYVQQEVVYLETI
jgi:uncharacterized protein